MEAALAKAEKGRRLSDMRAGAAATLFHDAPSAARLPVSASSHCFALSAEAERLLRACQEQLEVAKREMVMFKRSAHQTLPRQQEQQRVSLSHVSQPLLNSYIGAAIR